MTNTIDTGLTFSSIQSGKSQHQKTLGQEAFLQLLVTQLQNQDPMNPMEDTQFISQLATFSSLEQLMSLNESMNSILQLQKDNQLILFNQLLGKEVMWKKISNSENDIENITVEEGSGILKSVQMTEEGPVFLTDTGTVLYLENIIQLTNQEKQLQDPPKENNPLVQASQLIGYRVFWKNGEEEFNGIVQAVNQKDGQITYLLDDENQLEIPANQITAIER